jgi:hypothetical protein
MVTGFPVSYGQIHRHHTAGGDIDSMLCAGALLLRMENGNLTIA